MAPLIDFVLDVIRFNDASSIRHQKRNIPNLGRYLKSITELLCKNECIISNKEAKENGNL